MPYEKRWADMIDPSDFERIAMDVAGEFGGAFLEEINQTDLSKLTPEQWKEFINIVCTQYAETLIKQEAAAVKAASKVKNTQTVKRSDGDPPF